MKKHSAFEKTVKAQESKLTSLSQFARQLIGQDHYAASQISLCLDAVLERKRNLDDITEKRRHRLDDSKRYQKFLSNVYEVSNTKFQFPVNQFRSHFIEKHFFESWKLFNKIQDTR